MLGRSFSESDPNRLCRDYSITSSARARTLSGIFEPKRLRRLEIDHQLIFRRRLHGQISRLFALEDAIDIARCEAKIRRES
jgi:hypothetical protein